MCGCKSHMALSITVVHMNILSHRITAHLVRPSESIGALFGTLLFFFLNKKHWQSDHSCSSSSMEMYVYSAKEQTELLLYLHFSDLLGTGGCHSPKAKCNEVDAAHLWEFPLQISSSNSQGSVLWAWVSKGERGLFTGPFPGDV